MNILYYDCFSGISGDMNMGALIDLGVDPDYLIQELKKLKVEGYELKIYDGLRKNIKGTKVDVILKEADNKIKYQSHTQKEEHYNTNNAQHGQHHSDEDHHHSDEIIEEKSPDHGHRTLEDITQIIEGSNLGSRIKKMSLSIFHKVAEAEAKIHGKPLEEIHFHEVGAIDSIVDIVGAAICIEFLKPDKIMASSIELGGGFVKCAHGIFPVPAPATAEILKNVPVKSGAVQSETTTPTGAAILATIVNEFTDHFNFSIEKTGYGLGTKDLDIPNVLRVYWGKEHPGLSSEPRTHQALVIECNIDDMNPEFYGYIMDKLFEMGADDVFITPIIMKKARPASILSVLCNKELEQPVTELLLTHTTSLGVRQYRVDKTHLDREFKTVKTKYGEVTVKTAIYQGKKLKSKPEYEDCIKIAREKNIPVHLVYQEVNRLITNMNENEE